MQKQEESDDRINAMRLRAWVFGQKLRLWGYWPPGALLKSIRADIADRWETAPMQVMVPAVLGIVSLGVLLITLTGW